MSTADDLGSACRFWEAYTRQIESFDFDLPQKQAIDTEKQQGMQKGKSCEVPVLPFPCNQILSRSEGHIEIARRMVEVAEVHRSLTKHLEQLHEQKATLCQKEKQDIEAEMTKLKAQWNAKHAKIQEALSESQKIASACEVHSERCRRALEGSTLCSDSEEWKHMEEDFRDIVESARLELHPEKQLEGKLIQKEETVTSVPADLSQKNASNESPAEMRNRYQHVIQELQQKHAEEIKSLQQGTFNTTTKSEQSHKECEEVGVTISSEALKSAYKTQLQRFRHRTQIVMNRLQHEVQHLTEENALLKEQVQSLEAAHGELLHLKSTNQELKCEVESLRKECQGHDEKLARQSSSPQEMDNFPKEVKTPSRNLENVVKDEPEMFMETEDSLNQQEVDVQLDLFKNPPSSLQPRKLDTKPSPKIPCHYYSPSIPESIPRQMQPRPSPSMPRDDVKCRRCGASRSCAHGPCHFHPFLLPDPGPLQHSMPWIKCKRANHTLHDAGCYTRAKHFF